MSDTTRIFIVEQDEPSLIMLNLWLDNFEDIEIVGTSLGGEDVLDRVLECRPDVVVFKWQTSTVAKDTLRQLKTMKQSPALVSIRDGNFLALEGMINSTPEILIPSTYSCNDMLESIRRAAVKRRQVRSANEISLPKAG